MITLYFVTKDLLPRWVASMWQLEKYFPDNNGALSN